MLCHLYVGAPSRPRPARMFQKLACPVSSTVGRRLEPQRRACGVRVERSECSTFDVRHSMLSTRDIHSPSHPLSHGLALLFRREPVHTPRESMCGWALRHLPPSHAPTTPTVSRRSLGQGRCQETEQNEPSSAFTDVLSKTLYSDESPRRRERERATRVPREEVSLARFSGRPRLIVANASRS